MYKHRMKEAYEGFSELCPAVLSYDLNTRAFPDQIRWCFMFGCSTYHPVIRLIITYSYIRLSIIDKWWSMKTVHMLWTMHGCNFCLGLHCKHETRKSVCVLSYGSAWSIFCHYWYSCGTSTQLQEIQHTVLWRYIAVNFLKRYSQYKP